MRHALGVDRPEANGKPYHNFFWTDSDSEDGKDMNPMVDAGLMWRSAPRAGFGGMCMYAVTDKGLAAMGVTDLSGLEDRERFGRPRP